MVKRGLSVEEKRDKVLDIYHSTKAIYSLKEIEKAASKQGVTINTVKDVNQSLVDDGLVDMDKIGASNFFWSFPSKVAVTKQNVVDNLEQSIAKAEDNTSANKRKISELEEGRADTASRREKLGRLQENGLRLQELEKEYELLKENDPAELEKVTRLTQVCKDGVNRWTDNSWCIKSWMVKTKGMSGKDVDRYLQIKETLTKFEFFNCTPSGEPDTTRSLVFVSRPVRMHPSVVGAWPRVHEPASCAAKYCMHTTL